MTVHAWLTHPAVVAWGDEWRRFGGGEVRFRRPVLDLERVTCTATPEGLGLRIDATGGADPEARATLVATPPDGSVVAPAPFAVTARHNRLPADATVLAAVDDLGTIDTVLDGVWGARYATECGDDLATYADGATVHPGVWLEAAHLAITQNIGLRTWVHTASTYRFHDALVPIGTAVSVRSRVVTAELRKGRDEIRLDVQLVVGVRVAVTVDHRAIVRLAG